MISAKLATRRIGSTYEMSAAAVVVGGDGGVACRYVSAIVMFRLR